MSDRGTKSAFLVDAYSDPVLVRIDGRADFHNSASLRDFIADMVRQGKRRFVIDFLQCTSMDSTFQGVLAEAALGLRRDGKGGALVLVRLGPRNLELVRNMGLHRLMTVDSGEYPMNFGACDTRLACPDHTELENARLVLAAHENLVAADESNRAKFQDVLVFLRDRCGRS
jgi:anti-sigma B factor antagonist